MTLRESFATKRLRHGAGFIPFILAGDPDLRTTSDLLIALSRLDPVAIELGVPFSDPTADGPVIQRAAQRALNNGTSLAKILQLLGKLRSKRIAPIVLFSYYNPILQFGLERFVRELAKNEIAGVLVVDLPTEASRALQTQLRRRKIDLISLVTPTTSDRRLEEIARAASGFIYAVARTGVTGTTRELADESEELVARIRRASNLPVAVGFGVSKRAQAQRICRYAEAAVVGSRLVAEIENAAAATPGQRAKIVSAAMRVARQFV